MPKKKIENNRNADRAKPLKQTIKGKWEAQVYIAKIINQKHEDTLRDLGKVKLSEHIEIWLEMIFKKTYSNTL